MHSSRFSHALKLYQRDRCSSASTPLLHLAEIDGIMGIFAGFMSYETRAHSCGIVPCDIMKNMSGHELLLRHCMRCHEHQSYGVAAQLARMACLIRHFMQAYRDEHLELQQVHSELAAAKANSACLAEAQQQKYTSLSQVANHVFDDAACGDLVLPSLCTQSQGVLSSSQHSSRSHFERQLDL